MANDIDNLPEVSEIQDDDVILIQQGDITKKISSINLKNILNEGQSNSSFNNVVSSYEASVSQQIETNEIKISGLDGERSVSIQGPNQPLIKRNGGEGVKSSKVKNGDVITCLLTSSREQDTVLEYFLNIGSARYSFTVVSAKTQPWDKSILDTPIFDLYADNEDSVLINSTSKYVEGWNSETGEKDFIQDTASRQPFYGKFWCSFNNADNSKNDGRYLPGIYIPNGNRYLYNGNFLGNPDFDLPKGGEPFTWFCVSTTLENEQYSYLFSLGRYNGSESNMTYNGTNISFGRHNTLLSRNTGATSGQATTGTFLQRDTHYYEPTICTAICDGKDISLYVNGEFIQTLSNYSKRYYSLMTIGRLYTSWNFWGWIHSMAFYRGQMSVDNARAYEKYLANRFNINEVLVDTHPFKNSNPTIKV